MDLPKNITQIGETNPHCKIYVEDYVISYIRQLNQYAGEKGLAVALYGTRKDENEITYLFLYGACKLNFLQRECRHLSQAVTQEAEKQRRKYFPDHVFLGYRLLDGEMVEGFHICEQGVCRYVEGYAQFYEKNDQMLAFMLDDRQGEAKPEEVAQEKYDMVKKRQEERRALLEEKQGHAFRKAFDMGKTSDIRKESGIQKERPASSVGSGKLAVAAAFVLLCGAGFAAMGGGEGLDRLRTDVKNLMEDMARKQLPDVVEVSGNAQVGTIVAEDKLTDAIRKENTAADPSQDRQTAGEAGTSPEESGADAADESFQTSQGAASGAAGERQPDQNQSGDPQQPDQNQSGDPQQPDQNQSAAQETPDSGQEAAGQQPDQNQSTVQQPPDSGQEAAGQQQPDQNQSDAQQPATEQSQTTGPVAEMVAYIVRRGDTMTDICLRQYGSDARVAEVCALNNISNPDDIKEGEKIFLPQ